MLETAAALIVLTAFAHSYLGERFLLIPLFRRDNLPRLLGSDQFTKGTLRFAWHITSVTWVAIAVVLVFDDQHSALFLYSISAATFISAVLAAGYTRGKHLSWVVFLAIALLTFLSAR